MNTILIFSLSALLPFIILFVVFYILSANRLGRTWTLLVERHKNQLGRLSQYAENDDFNKVVSTGTYALGAATIYYLPGKPSIKKWKKDFLAFVKKDEHSNFNDQELNRDINKPRISRKIQMTFGVLALADILLVIVVVAIKGT